MANLFAKETSATKEQLLDYKDSHDPRNDEIDDECCWGVAYQMHRYVWEQEVKEWMQNKFQGGYQEKRLTFYPRVSTVWYG